MHPLVKLAKDTIEEYVRSGDIIKPPSELHDEMTGKAAVFVSIKKKGELRGCIGTLQPTRESIALEIIQNAVSSATQDPRFPPVTPSEIDELEYSVDVLSEPERISGKEELDPKKYGVIVKSGEYRGLLLPDLEGVDTSEEQIRIAAMKAGIISVIGAELYRFEVKRYS
jgi:AmmeMemoRadiSam system protein A